MNAYLFGETVHVNNKFTLTNLDMCKYSFFIFFIFCTCKYECNINVYILGKIKSTCKLLTTFVHVLYIYFLLKSGLKVYM